MAKRPILSSLLILFCFINAAFPVFPQSKSFDSIRDMTMHVIPQSHIDIAWWWRQDPETIHVVVKKTLEAAFANMEKYPDYTFTFLQVPAIAPMETYYPELFYRMRYFAHNTGALGDRLWNPGASGEGRFEIAGGMWVEADANLISGESLVRQCMYGKHWYKYVFGKDVRTAWFQDSWSHPVTFPQILKKSGIDSYMFRRGEGGDDESMFWWQSPDGSRVFAYKPLFDVNAIEEHMAEMKRRYGIRNDILLIGIGNHGGGPTPGDVDNMRKRMADVPARAVFSKPSSFVECVLDEAREFPVVDYEITPTIRGAYTTAGEIKTENRRSETALMTLEKFASIAFTLGYCEYPYADITGAWQKVMLNQFHDTISGTDIQPATDDALKLYDEVLRVADTRTGEILNALAGNIDSRGAGIPIVVFNPLSWSRTGPVEFEMMLKSLPGAVRLADPEGKILTAQIVSHAYDTAGSWYRVKAVFLATGVPSLGYTCYHAEPVAAAGPPDGAIRVDKNSMENEFFSIAFDSHTGHLTSIHDKRHNREVLRRPLKGNVIQIIEDYGDSEGFLRNERGEIDTHHTWTGKTQDVDSHENIEIIESGPVRGILRLKRKFGLARFIQDIKIYSGVPRIDFELVIDWNGSNKMVKVAFPVNVNASSSTYEIPYGTIERPNTGEEFPAQKWIDISDGTCGVSLLNNCRYGHDVREGIMRLSVLRSPSQPAFATDERGLHVVGYSLYPHGGSWREAEVMRRGYEFNYPMLCLTTGTHNGSLPSSHSFISIETDNAIISVLKKAEYSDDLILRFFETEGTSSVAKIQANLPFDAVHAVDLLENDIAEITTAGRTFSVSAGGYAIESVRLIKDLR